MRRLSIAICVVLTGCALGPPHSVPEGTYIGTDDRESAVVFDADRVELHVPAAQHPRSQSPYGHDYYYELDEDGRLHFIGTSSQYMYLWDLDCDWFWTGDAVECRRGDAMSLTFRRAGVETPMSPATEEQRVWLAVADHLRGRGETTDGSELHLYSRSHFPERWGAVWQLREHARQEFCGHPYEHGRQVLAGLKTLSGLHDKSLRDVFARRSGFLLGERKPRDNAVIGLSVVLFDGSRHAYVSADLGGRTGVILRATRGHEWGEIVECARWGR